MPAPKQKGKQFINPLKRDIGRRTGRNIKAGKNIRIRADGFENFDDYLSESDADVTREHHQLKHITEESSGAGSSQDEISKENKIPPSDRLIPSQQGSGADLEQQSLMLSNTMSATQSMLSQNATVGSLHTSKFGWMKNRNIGRRTGKDIKANKQIRVDVNGVENFDDYFSESDASSFFSQSSHFGSPASSVKQRRSQVHDATRTSQHTSVREQSDQDGEDDTVKEISEKNGDNTVTEAGERKAKNNVATENDSVESHNDKDVDEEEELKDVDEDESEETLQDEEEAKEIVQDEDEAEEIVQDVDEAETDKSTEEEDERTEEKDKRTEGEDERTEEEDTEEEDKRTEVEDERTEEEDGRTEEEDERTEEEEVRTEEEEVRTKEEDERTEEEGRSNEGVDTMEDREEDGEEDSAEEEGERGEDSVEDVEEERQDAGEIDTVEEEEDGADDLAEEEKKGRVGEMNEEGGDSVEEKEGVVSVENEEGGEENEEGGEENEEGGEEGDVDTVEEEGLASVEEEGGEENEEEGLEEEEKEGTEEGVEDKMIEVIDIERKSTTQKRSIVSHEKTKSDTKNQDQMHSVKHSSKKIIVENVTNKKVENEQSQTKTGIDVAGSKSGSITKLDIKNQPTPAVNFNRTKKRLSYSALELSAEGQKARQSRVKQANEELQHDTSNTSKNDEVDDNLKRPQNVKADETSKQTVGAEDNVSITSASSFICLASRSRLTHTVDHNRDSDEESICIVEEQKAPNNRTKQRNKQKETVSHQNVSKDSEHVPQKGIKRPKSEMKSKKTLSGVKHRRKTTHGAVSPKLWTGGKRQTRLDSSKAEKKLDSRHIKKEDSVKTTSDTHDVYDLDADSENENLAAEASFKKFVSSQSGVKNKYSSIRTSGRQKASNQEADTVDKDLNENKEASISVSFNNEDSGKLSQKRGKRNKSKSARREINLTADMDDIHSVSTKNISLNNLSANERAKSQSFHLDTSDNIEPETVRSRSGTKQKLKKSVQKAKLYEEDQDIKDTNKSVGKSVKSAKEKPRIMQVDYDDEHAKSATKSTKVKKQSKASEKAPRKSSASEENHVTTDIEKPGTALDGITETRKGRKVSKRKSSTEEEKSESEGHEKSPAKKTRLAKKTSRQKSSSSSQKRYKTKPSSSEEEGEVHLDEHKEMPKGNTSIQEADTVDADLNRTEEASISASLNNEDSDKLSHKRGKRNKVKPSQKKNNLSADMDDIHSVSKKIKSLNNLSANERTKSKSIHLDTSDSSEHGTESLTSKSKQELNKSGQKAKPATKAKKQGKTSGKAPRRQSKSSASSDENHVPLRDSVIPSKEASLDEISESLRGRKLSKRKSSSEEEKSASEGQEKSPAKKTRVAKKKLRKKTTSSTKIAKKKSKTSSSEEEGEGFLQDHDDHEDMPASPEYPGSNHTATPQPDLAIAGPSHFGSGVSFRVSRRSEMLENVKSGYIDDGPVTVQMKATTGLTPCITRPGVSRRKKGRRVTICPEENVQHDISGGQGEGNTPPNVVTKRLFRHSAGMSDTGLPSPNSTPIHAFEMTNNSLPSEDMEGSPADDKLILPEPAINGLRRSQRTRVRPLDWNRGERIIFDNTNPDGPEIVGVQPSLEWVKWKKLWEEKSKRRKLLYQIRKSTRAEQQDKRPQRKLSIHTELPQDLQEVDTREITVINPYSQEEDGVECIYKGDSRKPVGPHHGSPKKEDAYLITQLVDQPFTSAGQLSIRPRAEKPVQMVQCNAVLFYVTYGKLLLKIHETKTLIETGDTFFVPIGNTYSLKNLRADTAKLFYSVFKDTGEFAEHSIHYNMAGEKTETEQQEPTPD